MFVDGREFDVEWWKWEWLVLDGLEWLVMVGGYGGGPDM